MKRVFYAALLMLAISAIAVFPAFAADGCADMSGMHEASVASLVMHVRHASEMGHIKAWFQPSLTATLTAATNESLPIAARVDSLNGFIGLVNAQAGKGISADCAAMLVKQAQQVVVALQG